MNVLQSKIDEVKNGTSSFYSLTDSPTYNKIGNDKLLKEGWRSNEDVYAICSRLATLVSSLPVKLMDGDELVSESDPMFLKFYDNWNQKRGLVGELYLIVLNQLIYGRSYIYKKSDIVGFAPNELWTLNTSQITPSTKSYSYFENPDYYTLFNGSKSVKLYPEELIITDNLSLETDYESQFISPLQASWSSVVSSNNRANAEKVMLENRGIAGFISPKATSGDNGLIGFMDNTMDAIRSAFAKLTGGSKKFNKVELIQQAAEFTQLGMSAGDLKIIEMRLNHVRSICNAYGVPSLLFNDYQSRTHANYKEALKSMYTDAVIPLFKKWKQQFEKQYLNDVNKMLGKSYYLKLDMSEIEALNRSVADVFTGLNPQIANRMMDNMSAEEIREIMLELGLIKS